MKIKIVFGQDIRRWRYPATSRFESLVKFSQDTFNLSSNDKFYFQFHDDEGDRMTLSSESDLDDALVTAAEDGRKSLKIFLINGSIENARQQKSDIFKSGIAPSVASIPSTDDFDVVSNVSRVESYPQSPNETRSASQTPDDNESKAQTNDTPQQRSHLSPCENLLNLLQNEAVTDLLPDFIREVFRVLRSDVNEGIEVAAMRVLTMDEFSVINEQIKLADIFSIFNSIFQDNSGNDNENMMSDSRVNESSSREVHVNVACDMCGASPIVGVRYKCCLCRNFDMCSACERKNTHDKTHPILKFSTPTNGFMWGTLPGLKEMFEKNCWFRNRFNNGNSRFGWGRGRRKHGHHNHNNNNNNHNHNHHNGNDYNKRGGWGNWHHPMGAPHMNFGQHFTAPPPPPPHHMPPPGHPFHGWGHFGWTEGDSSNRPNINQSQHSSRGGVGNCSTASNSSTVNSNTVNKNNKLKADFVCNVNMPDRERYPSDTILEKSWKMRNSGAIEWGNNCELVFVKGNEKLSLQERYQVVNAQPGEEVIISAMIKTPSEPGRYCSYYRLECNKVKFGPRVWVDVFVDDNNNGNQSSNHANDKKLKKREMKMARKAEKLQRRREKLTRELSELDQIPHTDPGSDGDNNNNNERSVRRTKKLQKRLEKLTRKIERTNDKINQNGFEVAENSVSSSSSIDASMPSAASAASEASEASAPILNTTLPNTNATDVRDEGLTIRCVLCGDPMILIEQSRAYTNAMANVHCDICGKNCGSEMVYHCTRGKSMVHSDGYDLCTGCVELQKKSFRSDPAIVSTIDDVSSAEFAYPNQLEQLLSMGFANDVETLKQLLMKHNGNLDSILQQIFSS